MTSAIIMLLWDYHFWSFWSLFKALIVKQSSCIHCCYIIFVCFILHQLISFINKSKVLWKTNIKLYLQKIVLSCSFVLGRYTQAYHCFICYNFGTFWSVWLVRGDIFSWYFNLCLLKPPSQRGRFPWAIIPK